MNELARDLHQGRLFTDRHLDDPSDVTRVFMVLALGALADYDPEDLKQIGLVYEYLDKAGPRSCNGMPMFLSVQFLNVEDTGYVFEKYKAFKDAEKALLAT